MADVLLFLWEHIWQTIIIVLGMQAVFVYKKESLINCVKNFLKISDTIDSRKSKYGKILQKLEVGKKANSNKNLMIYGRCNFISPLPGFFTF